MSGTPVQRPPLIVRFRSPAVATPSSSSNNQPLQQPPQVYMIPSGPRTMHDMTMEEGERSCMGQSPRSSVYQGASSPVRHHTGSPPGMPHWDQQARYQMQPSPYCQTYSPPPGMTYTSYRNVSPHNFSPPNGPPQGTHEHHPAYGSPNSFTSQQSAPQNRVSGQYYENQYISCSPSSVDDSYNVLYSEAYLLATVRDGFGGIIPGVLQMGTPEPPALAPTQSLSPTRLPSIGNFLGSCGASSQQPSPRPSSLESMLERYNRGRGVAGESSPFQGPTATLESTPRLVSTETTPQALTPVSRIIISSSGLLAGRDVRQIIDNAKNMKNEKIPRARTPKSSPARSATVVLGPSRRRCATAPGKARSAVRGPTAALPSIPAIPFHGNSKAVVLDTEMPSPLPLPSPSSDEDVKPDLNSMKQGAEGFSNSTLSSSVEDIPPPLVIPVASSPHSPTPSPSAGQDTKPPGLSSSADSSPQRQSLRLCINRKNLAVSLIPPDLGSSTLPSVPLGSRVGEPAKMVSVSLSTASGSANVRPGTKLKAKSVTKTLPVTPMSVNNRTNDPKKNSASRTKLPAKKGKVLPTAPVAAPDSVSESSELEKLREGDVDLTSPASVLATALFEKIDLRAKFDMLPAAVRHEVMGLMPESYKSVDMDGRVELKEGILSKNDTKFRKHMQGWQSSLLGGEFDTDTRKRYVEYGLASIDRWKVDNFEPAYGDIMRGSAPAGRDLSRTDSSAAASSSSTVHSGSS